MNSFILTGGGVSGIAVGRPFTVDSSHVNYGEVIEALKAKQYERIHDLIDVGHSLEQFAVTTHIAVDPESETVYYKGVPLHHSMVDRILSMKAEGFDIVPMTLFLENLMSNPSQSAIEELYGFLEAGKMPITEDGHFIAWKRVNGDMTSIHDGTTLHVFGQELRMPREQCNSNRHQTCSTGLHFCSQSYLPYFSAGSRTRILILKINPRDVVSIPSDYNNAKGRACAYTPIGEVDGEARDRLEVEEILTQPVVVTTSVADDDLDAMEKHSTSTFTRLGALTFEEGFSDGVNRADDGMLGVYQILQERRSAPNTEWQRGYVAGVESRLPMHKQFPPRYISYNIVNARPDTRLKTTVDATNVNATLDFITGYKHGYSDGKAKIGTPYVTNFGGAPLTDLQSGYDLGHKHGRGHKPKLYK